MKEGRPTPAAGPKVESRQPFQNAVTGPDRDHPLSAEPHEPRIPEGAYSENKVRERPASWEDQSRREAAEKGIPTAPPGVRDREEPPGLPATREDKSALIGGYDRTYGDAAARPRREQAGVYTEEGGTYAGATKERPGDGS